MRAPSKPSRKRLAAIAAIGLALPLAGLLALGLSSGGTEASGCMPERVEVAPIEESTVATGPDPLPWQLSAQPVDKKQLRHNHLHGGIVVQYGNRVPETTVGALRDWYDDDPVGLVVAPLPELGAAVLATAWAGRLSCSRFDEDSFADFRDEHRFRGPERVPPAELRP